VVDAMAVDAGQDVRQLAKLERRRGEQ
jgi:hypothetical protein